MICQSTVAEPLESYEIPALKVTGAPPAAAVGVAVPPGGSTTATDLMLKASPPLRELSETEAAVIVAKQSADMADAAGGV